MQTSAYSKQGMARRNVQTICNSALCFQNPGDLESFLTLHFSSITTYWLRPVQQPETFVFFHAQVSNDHFSRLPDCLLDNILVFVCNDRRVNLNTTLKRLRCCSKALCRASDAARISITLHLTHLNSAATAVKTHLQKLTGLTRVHLVNSNKFPVLRDLTIVSNAQPQLKSLSFVSDDEVYTDL